MKEPFYETEFDVKEYISKHILEIDSLADRKLYEQMAVSFLLPFFEIQRQENINLTKRVLDEVSLSDDCYNIGIGLIEKRNLQEQMITYTLFYKPKLARISLQILMRRLIIIKHIFGKICF